MKTTFFKPIIGTIAIVILSSIFSCNKKEEILPDTTGSAKLKVKLINNTGIKLSNLELASKKLGTLNNNNSTNYISYPQFGFDSNWPDEKIMAINNNDTLYSYNQFYWCGTQKEIRYKGTYDMLVTLHIISGKKYLQLTLK